MIVKRNQFTFKVVSSSCLHLQVHVWLMKEIASKTLQSILWNRLTASSFLKPYSHNWKLKGTHPNAYKISYKCMCYNVNTLCITSRSLKHNMLGAICFWMLRTSSLSSGKMSFTIVPTERWKLKFNQKEFWEQTWLRKQSCLKELHPTSRPHFLVVLIPV